MENYLKLIILLNLLIKNFRMINVDDDQDNCDISTLTLMKVSSVLVPRRQKAMTFC